MKYKIIDTIRAKRIEKEQEKNSKKLIKDAYFLANGNQEFWVTYFDNSSNFAQRKIQEHNLSCVFHSSVWRNMEPNEKIAALILLDRKLIIEGKERFTPSQEGKFVVTYDIDEDYTCTREGGQNVYYIHMRMLADEFLEPYAFLYMLKYLHIQSKGWELIEDKTLLDKDSDYANVALNLKNPKKEPEAYEKFLFGEVLNPKEQVQVCEYICQPIEQLAKKSIKYLEDVYLEASSPYIGVGMEDLDWKYYLEDYNLLKKEEEALIFKTFGFVENKIEPYLKSLKIPKLDLEQNI